MRDCHRTRHREIDRDRDRDCDRDSYRDRDHDRKRDCDDLHHRSRSCSLKHTFRRSRSRSRTYSPERHRDLRHHDRHRSLRAPTPSNSPPPKPHKDVVSDFVEGISKETKKKHKKYKGKDVSGDYGNGDGDGDMMDSDDMEMMKQLGNPVGFYSMKGNPVEGNDVSGVRKITKRQPRQYMNRRGGFNRPLPSKFNR